MFLPHGVDALVIIFCLSLTSILYKNYPRRFEKESNIRPRGYILENRVTHARLLPVKSAHAFTYPTLSLLVSLDALESHSLDIGKGWIFGYGGLWGRLVGIRPNSYLSKQRKEKTIREKLEAVLRERGFLDRENPLEDAWMMTMPSLIGFEGINPLTVYFCYKSGTFWLTVLEIHNTFGETHVHVLEIDKNEDADRPQGYDHQWTFLREFHVSPFNDRGGFYTISIKNPSHPPIVDTSTLGIPPLPPRPAVRIHFHTLSLSEPPTPGTLKLTALLRPTSAIPLKGSSLLFALSRAPFVLLLSFPRILYRGWILHYKKRLDVFIRPEPLPATQEWGSGIDFLATQEPNRRGGGIKWLNEGLFDKYARRRVEEFLSRRVEQTGIAVTLIAANPSVQQHIFFPSSHHGLASQSHLKISYLSPRFFTVLFLCPSASHALLLGSTIEGVFFISSTELFIATFSTPAISPPVPGVTLLQSLRTWPIPASLTLPEPHYHALDDNSVMRTLVSGTVIWTLLVLERLEFWIFWLFRARIVEGEEPWKRWDRAAANLSTKYQRRRGDPFGSIRRDSNVLEI